MADVLSSLDYWRKLFHSADCDIFEVIENAILVAAADCPKEFRSRRDRIAEKLFACRLSRCSGCRRVELWVPEHGEEAEEDDDDGSIRRVSEKESKVDSSNSEPGGYNRGRESNNGYDEAEALTEEMEEETQIVGEVMRIKEILCNQEDEPDSFMFESLRRLQLMELSVETLKATEIGRAVNGLRKHASKPIRCIARTLIESWKLLVDEWVNSTAAIVDHSPESTNPSVLDEEDGLPFPPLDEGALLASTSIQLSEFFDEMDDDGNLRTTVDFNKKQETPKQLSISEERGLKRSKKASFLLANPQPVHKTSRSTSEQKPSTQFRKPSTDLKEKIELAKRKLHERYQQAENAKKQRTIQVMELHDLPKQTQTLRQNNLKPRNQVRSWANARR
ncbi:hypothetical protein HPP92_006789 [Vanilla planifolia]|uniref:TFIIS N-terminal domain-containing protein n=1 Tax=Vanilla planifolia TaxID=51239 RepID=A0A835RCN9_VANPL|nr:hypothetical protein HPP92_006789 [Vanilla planifolia]